MKNVIRKRRKDFVLIQVLLLHTFLYHCILLLMNSKNER